MKLSFQSESLLDGIFQRLIDTYSNKQEETILTDFHLQPVRETGELNVYDDDDNLLCSAVIGEWADYADEGGDDEFFDEVSKDLQRALGRAGADGAWERLQVWKPFSFVLVDNQRETVCDLLLVDDDTLLVNDTLMQGLDDELNYFLEQLLGEEN